MNEYSFMIWRCRIALNPKNADKYQRILASAVHLFAGQGFFQTTISQIARRAGVADGTIYLYFKNKEDILIQFFTDKTRQVFDRFREAVEQADDAVGRLRSLIRCHLEAFQQDRDMALVYLMQTHQSHRPAEEQIRLIAKRYHDLIAEIIEQGQAEGRLRKDLYIGLVKRFISGSVDEIINAWLHSDSSYDLASMADPLVDLLIDGIGSKPEAV